MQPLYSWASDCIRQLESLREASRHLVNKPICKEAHWILRKYMHTRGACYAAPKTGQLDVFVIRHVIHTFDDQLREIVPLVFWRFFYIALVANLTG